SACPVPPTTTTTSTTSSSSTSSTTSTSTTTVVASTSSTSSSTTSSSTLQPTTTTTVPATGCGGIPDGPTLHSILCRLNPLRTDTAATGALGTLRPKLDQPLGKAVQRTGETLGFCASNDPKHAKARLKQVVRQLVQYSHRLRARKARKLAPTDAAALAER